MAAVTHLGGGSSTTDGTVFTTASSFAPAVSDLLVIWVTVSASTDPAPTVTESAGGGTYSLVGFAVKATSADALYCFVRNTLCETTANRTFTFTTTVTATAWVFGAAKVTGMGLAGASAIRQSIKSDNQAASSTPQVVFPGVALFANPVIGGMANATNPATMTPPAGFTERQDAGQTTPTVGQEYASINGGFVSNTVTWGSVSSTANCAFAVELDTTGGVPFVASTSLLSAPTVPTVPTVAPEGAV